MRFSEFNVCWTTYKLEACAKIYDGTHQTPKYTKSGIRFISVENISNLYDSQKFISLEDFKKEFKIHPQINDILMTRIGDIGTPAVVSKEDPLAYYVSLALIRPLKNLYYLYIYDYIQTPYFKKELWHRTLHIAFPQKINKEEIGKCKISIPCEKEQFKIGNFLSLLDQRIDTQSKIIEDLEYLNKSICNRIISNLKIQKTTKLGLLASVYQPETISQSQFIKNGEYNVYGANGIIGKYNKFNHTNSEILLSCRGNCGTINLSEPKSWINGNAMVIHIDNNDTLKKYLYYYLKTINFSRFISGSGVPQITRKPIENLKIIIPSPIEQQFVVQFMESLFLKTKKEKDILELYKKQKAYLLKNMFI